MAVSSSYTPEQIARAGTEHAHQAALFCWLRRKTHYHPELEWIFAVPNGGSRDKITAGKLKAEGVTPGVFDFIHGGIGRSDQIFAVYRMIRVQADTNRGGRYHFFPLAQQAGLLQLTQQLLSQHG